MPRRRGERPGSKPSGAVQGRASRRALIPGPGALGRLCLAGAFGLGLGIGTASVAQTADAAPQPRRLALEPSASVTQTFTDNHDLRSSNPQADAITRLTAGIGFRGNTGAVRGYLDYALSSLTYARHSERNSLQNALSANLSADLIEDRLQLLAAANISRIAVSAFGVRPGGGADANSNTTELRSLRLTPTLRGPLGPGLRYTASLAHTITDSDSASNGDVTSNSANVRLEPSNPGKLRWALDASHLASDYKRGRSTQSDRVLGTLLLDLDILDLQLSATGGSERTNLASQDARNYRTWGLGLLWTPSPITRLSAEVDNRFFGRSHAFGLEYRTPRTAWTYRNARSLSTDDTRQLGLRGPASQVLGILLGVPDSDPRVNSLLDLFSLNAADVISTGFLQSAVSLQNQQQLSAAWTGPRDAAVLVASRSKTRRVDTLSSAFDDLLRTAEVRLTSLTLNLSHRLTPLSALTVALSTQHSRGSTAQFSSRQAQAELQLTTRLTPQSVANVSLRHARYKTGQQPFDETAVTASYGIRF